MPNLLQSLINQKFKWYATHTVRNAKGPDFIGQDVTCTKYKNFQVKGVINYTGEVCRLRNTGDRQPACIVTVPAPTPFLIPVCPTFNSQQ
jgi:hypothetical protein